MLPNREIRPLRDTLPRRDWAALLLGERAPLKRRPRDEVWRFDGFIAKCSLLDSTRRRLQRLTRSSRAWRYWSGARWLREHGFLAPRPMAILRGRGHQGPVEVFILAPIRGTSLIEILAGRGLLGRPLACRAQHALARELGGQALALASLGRVNRDHKPSNLIVSRADAWGAEVGIIDCVAIRRAPPAAALARMLACLVIEPTGLGCPPRRALRARGLLAACPDRAQRRTLLREVERLVTDHGDPVPRDNPLAPTVAP